MKQWMVIMMAVLAAGTPVSARIGDNSETLDDAYGTIMQRRLRDDGTVSITYTKGRFLYRVIFSNDRSISESYSHVKGTDLSEKEIQGLLKANAGRAKWIAENTGTERRFKRSDGKAEAIYAPVDDQPALTVREIRSGHRRGDQ